MAVALSAIGARARTTVVDTDVTPAMPTGWQVGDTGLLVRQTNTQGTSPTTAATITPATPSGWTLIDAGVSPNTARNSRLEVFWRILQSADTGPACQFEADGIGNEPNLVSYLLAFSGGVTSGNPVDASLASTGGTNSISLAAITTTGEGRMLVMIGAHSRNLTHASSAFAGSGITAVTEELDESETAGSDYEIWAVTAQQASAGSTGAYTDTATGTAAGYRGLLLALSPAAAATSLVPPSPSRRFQTHIAR